MKTASVCDQSWIRKCLFMPLRGDAQRNQARLGVYDGRFYIIRGGCVGVGAHKWNQRRRVLSPWIVLVDC